MTEGTIQKKTGIIGYTQHKTKMNKAKYKTQYVLDTTNRKQTQIT